MTNPSAHDIFWLARYAHNTLDPLIKAAQQYDPSTSLEIEMLFCHADSPYFANSHLKIVVRAKSQGNSIMVHSFGNLITTTSDVGKVAAKVQTFIDAEQAALEAAEDAKVEEEFLKTLDGNVAGHTEYVEALNSRTPEADAQVVWELRQERAAERADIEVEAA